VNARMTVCARGAAEQTLVSGARVLRVTSVCPGRQVWRCSGAPTSPRFRGVGGARTRARRSSTGVAPGAAFRR
jgi:hypothetical protein